MLNKLLKYDLKSLFSLLIPLYIGGLVLAIVNGFFLIPAQTKLEIWQFDLWSIMLELFHSMSILTIMSLNLIAMIWCIIRVYNSLFAKEGYLTNTLPLTHHQILWSKIISSFIACLVTSIVVILLWLIFSVGYLEFSWNIAQLLEYYNISEIADALKNVPLYFYFSISLCAFVISICYILVVFASMSIGHLTKHRILMSFVVFFALQYVIIQPATSVVVFSYILNLSNFSGTMFSSFSNNETLPFMSLIWIIIGLYSVFSVVCYLISSHILKNKLNLQ